MGVLQRRITTLRDKIVERARLDSGAKTWVSQKLASGDERTRAAAGLASSWREVLVNKMQRGKPRGLGLRFRFQFGFKLGSVPGFQLRAAKNLRFLKERHR
eukprot:1883722-Prorocentrum_lima.AAC.1